MPMPPAYHESLPYIDSQPSESELAAANDLIAAEIAVLPPPSMTAAPAPNFTPIFQSELERVAAQAPLQPLTLSRYEAQETPSGDAGADRLKEVLDNAHITDMYLSSRRQNLELLDRYGKNAWLIGNHELEGELKRLEAELAATKKEVDLVNLARQRRQEDVRGELTMLEETWKKGVGRVLETEVAVEELKSQIRAELRNQGKTGQDEQ
ncbi:Pre-mRNA-splicing factor SPF27 [Emericellopsis atlantica]|uniref:Pre-mRNA-splicing factor SPF27 n=1 Tax=Emericellopsis atlantica TaxID=2614577 RepID=A0A9P7ZH54_9HYPO|nr:Pre-mRNA-splicing factor SPF27 [Emericellopsis atlantica]KAG9251994.1 Pre-mRNA-splicing factor SPF27 [Emericellopsis atlantica]